LACASSTAFGVSHRDVEGAAAVAAEVARPAVSGGARDSPSRLGAARRHGLRFPIVVKANIGGSGAGIVRYDRQDDLERAVAEGRVQLGIDGTRWSRSSFRRATAASRGRVLGYKYLYAINVYSSGESFNLCPARHLPVDRRRRAGARRLPGGCAEEQPARRARRSRCRRSSPTSSGIMRAADIEIGGVEYMIDDPRRAALLLRHQRPVRTSSPTRRG
jgi:hypothetical protein